MEAPQQLPHVCDPTVAALFGELAQSSDMVFWFTAVHPERILYVSPAFEKLWGISAEALYREPRLWVETIHPDDRPAVNRAFEDLVSGRRATFEVEYRVVQPSGAIIWIFDKGLPVYDREGRVQRVCGTARDVTSRRQIETALVESEERYRSVIESLTAGVVVIDPSGIIRACNDSAERILGIGRAALIGLSLLETEWHAIHEDGTRFAHESFPIVKTLRTGQPCHDVTMGVRRPNGELRWILISTQPVVLPDTNRPQASVASFQDITERKQQLDEVFRTHQMLQAIIDNSPQAIIAIDRKIQVKIWNPAAEEIFGWRAEEVLGQPLPIVPEPAKKHFADIVARAFDRHETFRNEEVVRQRRDGTTVYVSLSTAMLRDAAGEEQTVMGVLSDISARKAAEASLRESETRFRQLADHLDHSFWLIDWPFQKVLYISPGFETVWGRTCQSVTEQPNSWVDAMLPDDRDRVLRAFNQDAPLGKYDVQFRILRPDGEVRWVRDRAFPIRNAAGEVYRIAGISVDMTERHRYEEQLRQRDSELAHLARVSTLGEMAAQLAHEINQPLYAISNYAQACKNELEKGDKLKRTQLEEPIQKIVNLAHRAGEIIRRIQQFVKRQEPASEPADINEIVRDVATLLEASARREQVRTDFKLARNLPSVNCDHILIQQVLLNLMRNAIEAMEETKIKNRRLTVQTAFDSVQQDIVVSVSDTGKGLPQVTAEKLFEPFYSTKDSGLGMGLAICKTTILAHGGRIWATPHEPLGTTFSFTLPISRTRGTDQI